MTTSTRTLRRPTSILGLCPGWGNIVLSSPVFKSNPRPIRNLHQFRLISHQFNLPFDSLKRPICSAYREETDNYQEPRKESHRNCRGEGPCLNSRSVIFFLLLLSGFGLSIPMALQVNNEWSFLRSLRIPSDADQRSEMMAIAIPN